ncbi:MAG TPA: ankyrin repeat domain-containing protein [Steroidobacter sp.]|uniref:ankyrin repeat domain-containing protein n=1 Tax=Steroidobacter sp. TaxID=1978227 RepID=UPI002ED9CE35
MPAPDKYRLHRLVRAGDLAAIRALPPLSARELNEFDASRKAPLMYAVQLPTGGVPIVQELLRRGAWLNVAEQNLLSLALAGGDPQMLPALLAAGLDVKSAAANGYDALITAVHGRDVYRDARLIDSLKLLIAHGAPLNGVSDYNETALRVLSRMGRFDAVRFLIEAGADPAHLKWTPLMHAVAYGSLSDVQAHLHDGDLERRDTWKMTPYLLAIRAGDIAKAELLRDAGADVAARSHCETPAIFHAIEIDRPDVLRWLLRHGCDVSDTDQFGTPALIHAVEHGAANCVDALLELGVDIEAEQYGSTALRSATSADVAYRLLRAGADPARISDESRRAFLGLDPDPDVYLLTASQEQFERAMTRRFGRGNPEQFHEPFWESMIRAGVSAYAAAEWFATGRKHERPVWCARRFGQSMTFLPDGRIVQIGGEHEDHYDPDFCIYNDVFVHERNGAIRIYGYREAEFPPTDFHTATLFEDCIYIIGGLGYLEQRRYGETPIFRLHLEDFHIERLRATGAAPGWIYSHRAQLLDSGVIRITGGTIVTLAGDDEDHSVNQKAFLLDVGSLRWSS